MALLQRLTPKSSTEWRWDILPKGTNPAAMGDRQEPMRISASPGKEPASKKRDGMGEEAFTAFAGANTAKQCQRRWVISA